MLMSFTFRKRHTAKEEEWYKLLHTACTVVPSHWVRRTAVFGPIRFHLVYLNKRSVLFNKRSRVFGILLNYNNSFKSGTCGGNKW